MATNKNEIKHIFRKKVKALGISIVNLAAITGYKKSTLYGISSGNGAPTNMLWAYFKLLEILQNKGYLQDVLQEYSITAKGATMLPSTEENIQEQVQKLDDVLERAEKFKSVLAVIADLDTEFADIYTEIKALRDDLTKNDKK